MGQPAENVWIAMQFIEMAHLGMLDSEVGQEVTHRAAVVTDGIWMECSSQRVNRASEQLGQRMLQWRAARAIHRGVTETGRMC